MSIIQIELFSLSMMLDCVHGSQTACGGEQRNASHVKPQVSLQLPQIRPITDILNKGSSALQHVSPKVVWWCWHHIVVDDRLFVIIIPQLIMILYMPGNFCCMSSRADASMIS